MKKLFVVLFKSVEKRMSPSVYFFETEEEARSYIEKYCSINKLKICSSLGWQYNDEERNDLDDYRVEDADGDSYYFVIYKRIIA